MNSPHSFRVRRRYDATADLVFRMWTDPKYLSLWWGIDGASNPVCELNVRRGGKWRIDMQSSSGRIYRNEGEYLDVVENERLVYTHLPDPGLAEWEGQPPVPSIHTVNFEGQGQRTDVEMLVEFESHGACERMIKLGMPDGLSQGLARLARLLVAAQARLPTEPT